MPTCLSLSVNIDEVGNLRSSIHHRRSTWQDDEANYQFVLHSLTRMRTAGSRLWLRIKIDLKWLNSNLCFLLICLDDDSTIGERTFSISQLASTLGKKVAGDAASVSSSVSDMVHSTSYQDIFSCENSERAKEMIINGVRHDCHHNYNRAVSEYGSDENIATRIEPSQRPIRKGARLLAGPRFRAQTNETEANVKSDTIYPISVRNPRNFLFVEHRLTRWLSVSWRWF